MTENDGDRNCRTCLFRDGPEGDMVCERAKGRPCWAERMVGDCGFDGKHWKPLPDVMLAK